MKILIVGSNPSKRGVASSTLRNLYKWMDRIGIKHFSFTNLSTVRTPNNRPLRKSEYQLERLCTECQNYDTILGLGKAASNALTWLNINHFCLPHPSGLNRQLNDKEFMNDRLNQLSAYCSGRPPSHPQIIRQNK